MATYTKFTLSGSTDGKAIVVGASATPGTLIHTADAIALDELWLWVSNFSTADQLTVEWGAAGVPGDHLVHIFNVPQATNALLICEGLVITNSKVVRAFSAAGGHLNIFGYVNRIG